MERKLVRLKIMSVSVYLMFSKNCLLKNGESEVEAIIAQ